MPIVSTQGRAGRIGRRMQPKYRGLGLVATPVGASMVYGSSPITRGPNGVWGANPPRAYPGVPIVSPAAPVTLPTLPTSTPPICPAWGCNGPTLAKNPIVYGGSPTTTPSPIWNPGWGSSGWGGRGGYGSGGWSAQNNPYGSSPQNPQNSQALAAAMALLQTNPSLLSPQQFSMLQQAGLVSSTLPYSSVSQIQPNSALTAASTASGYNDPNCVAAGCTGGPYPNCTCAAAAATTSTDLGSSLETETLFGIPLLYWALGGGAVLLFMSMRRR